MMTKMSGWGLCLTLFMVLTAVSAVAKNPAWTCWANTQGVPEDFIPDTDDCSVYYVCTEQYVPVEHQCPNILLADMNLEICQWPQLAYTYPGCGGDSW